VSSDQVLLSLAQVEWAYAPYDESGALQEIAERIARTGRLGTSLISYSNLVAGMVFRFSNVNNGEPFTIDTHNWYENIRVKPTQFTNQ